MKKVFIIITIIFIATASCKKDSEIKGIRDLKNLSLPQLKKFLNGKWSWQYSVIHNFGGFPDTIRNSGYDNYLLFYPVDSVLRYYEASNITIKEKLHYKYTSLSGGGAAPSVHVLMFAHDGFDFFNNWVADRLESDTLVFVDYFKSEGHDIHCYIKEK